MSNMGISNTNTGPVDTNVTMPGPTGAVGDMKANPTANPNIPQNDVGSTQHVSREATEVTRPGTKAFENKQDALEKSDPERQKLDREVLKAVMVHGNPSGANLQTNPSVSAEYGE
ncbi:MAG: hypothetical protein LBS22_03100 [Puniceicoccales bacterium]|jgi:hypothetical protein|nr:hypothetical protein [Puniceicoccales bacterium]